VGSQDISSIYRGNSRVNIVEEGGVEFPCKVVTYRINYKNIWKKKIARKGKK